MTAIPVELGGKRRQDLVRVFRLYDFNSDGYMDVNDMRVLGWALSLRQRVPEPHEASLQIQRADVDGDLLLSIDEFLRHSLALSLPHPGS